MPDTDPIDIWTAPDALAVWNRDGQRPEWNDVHRDSCEPGLVHLGYYDTFEAPWRVFATDGWPWEPDHISPATALAVLRDDSREKLRAWAKARNRTLEFLVTDDGVSIESLDVNGYCTTIGAGPTYDAALIAARKATEC